ncbi:hypothetical protein ACFLSZ_06175 [Candidatus Bipolaricaulota bacterium]
MTKRSGLSKGLSAATVAMTPDLDSQISRGRMKAIIDETMRDHADVRLILFGETILGWFYSWGQTFIFRILDARLSPLWQDRYDWNTKELFITSRAVETLERRSSQVMPIDPGSLRSWRK